MRVMSGEITALRLHAAANEIDLRRAERLWIERSGRASARSQLHATPAKAVAFVVPPLSLDLGAETLVIAGQPRQFMCSARLYDFGVVSLSLHLPIADADWAAFVALADDVDADLGPAALTDVWQRKQAELVALVGEAFDQLVETPLLEDYLIALVQAFDKSVTADELEARLDLVPLLSGQPKALSEGARRDLLRPSFSYYTDDLAVLAWDRAFLYEPRGETDVADVIELANAQLLEMRTYDELLNAELPRMRALTETKRPTITAFSGRRYARLARDLRALVAEITELTERVENALQVTEDIYLARVYSAAIDLLRVPRIGDAVDRKLAIIRETYGALQSEAESSRAELLEFAVIALIATEILLSLWRR